MCLVDFVALLTCVSIISELLNSQNVIDAHFAGVSGSQLVTTVMWHDVINVWLNFPRIVSKLLYAINWLDG